MTYAGADGATRTEMAKALHFPGDSAELDHSFRALRQGLEETDMGYGLEVDMIRQAAEPQGTFPGIG